ncbi:MAG: hypothetical protein ACHQNT_03610 [Bacteroidia bacterium]
MEIVLPVFKKLLLLLNKHKVNYMLIGGYAVIYHGYERSTTDMDIWLKPDNHNRDKLIPALKEFGIGDASLQKLFAVDFSQIQYFFFGEKPGRIDFLTQINNVTWSEAEPEVNYLPLQNEMVPVIHYSHLILSKIANNRPQDKADIEMLQKINQFKKK